MEQEIIGLIAKNCGIENWQAENTLKLIEEGATVPFISRYRKERTGNLDEVQIGAVADALDKIKALKERKEAIIKNIEKQGKLTDELKARISKSWDPVEVEDIYAPFKRKTKTRAESAREAGLEPLAKMIMSQGNGNVESMAQRFVKGKVKSTDDAIKGAKDIIAEWVSESEAAKKAIRGIFAREAVIESKVIKGKEEEGEKYKDYFKRSEPLKRCSSHRLLAMRRGESEKILNVSISADKEVCIDRLCRIFVRGDNESADEVEDAVEDSYKRLISTSIETEFANASKEKADQEAIKVFSENLRQLLLAPPLGQKRVMGIDPGFRTGCKVVCIDAQGNLLHNETIYPHAPHNKEAQARRSVQKMVEAYNIEAIAIGNGTASRETERFIANTRYDREVKVFVVSENGASIYSASKVAREEFPDYDVTVRGAVSIARRLMDPLAELVKIDPKSIGVGQYQHDVDQNSLKKALDAVVESCVNSVGVDVNTASRHLLMYVSGLGEQTAQNIVDYRAQNGPFKNRKELLKVSNIGNKTFEQCAGFLRIRNGENPLDNTAVHPESYDIVTKMAKDNGESVEQFIADKNARQSINLDKYVTEKTGLPTLKDIMQELDKPGRDPRKGVKVFSFNENVKTMDDLQTGMLLPGIVTNITNFGAFVDVGIKENGLVHISQMSDEFVNDPNQVVRLQQQVIVKVIGIDKERKRVQLSLKESDIKQ
ncbi:MAG: RNA-binding transcriptional accessory protein [Paludibacteraceae bacterium]|nr:RNA-binding transcriptional accessory protein [Paludibacteraceae bacterium]MBR0497725.1 RNA-binding transcriptional accessory protein [Paludibacteraceae bacterium]